MENFLLKNSKWTLLLFCVILCITLLFSGAFNFLFYGPSGTHFIRQIDSLNFIQFYKENGMKFLNTGSYSLESIDGKGVCEFPLHYYLIAWLETLWGDNILYLRFWNFSLSTLAITLFFNRANKYINYWPLSISIVLLLYFSAVLQFYQNNYLPDTSAWAVLFIGFYFSDKFRESEKTKYLLLSILFLCWAALIKPTFLIGLVAVSAALMFSYKEGVFVFVKKNYLWILLSFLSIIAVLLWSRYINSYNKVYNNFYFLTEITPIWKLDIEARKTITDFILNYWWTQYYVRPLHYIFGVLIFIGLVGYKKANRFIYFMSLFSLLGMIFYVLLFFKQFRDHDYYFILISFAVFLSVLNGLLVLIQLIQLPKFKAVLTAFFSLLLINSVIKVNEQLKERYTSESNEFYSAFYSELLQVKDELLPKIEPDYKVLLITDKTRNAGLYALNKYGWTISEFEESTIRNSLEIYGMYNGDETAIILSKKEYAKAGFLIDFLGEKLYEKGNISAYLFSEKYRLEAANQRRYREEQKNKQ